MAAVETGCADSDPSPLNGGIARFDIPIGDLGLRSAFRTFQAKTMGLKFHVKVYHKCSVILETKIFSENNS